MVSLQKIIDFLNLNQIIFSVQGSDINIKRLSVIAPEVEESLCYYVGDDPEKLNGIKKSIIICKPGLEVSRDNANTIIFTKKPQLCFYYLSSLFGDQPISGVHVQSLVNKSARLGKNISIGPFCVIEECHIGDNVSIDSGVKIYKGTVIGNNVQIQSNSVIGATGVMWTWDQNKQKIKCMQTGNVIIEDDVFIGSNITIVKGSFENLPTIIGRGTMIAHGTMIGHGCVIGAYNHLANNVSLAGSVRSGNNCFFGSGATVRPHIYLPHETIIGAGAVVVKNFKEDNLILIGNPADKLDSRNNKLAGIPEAP